MTPVGGFGNFDISMGNFSRLPAYNGKKTRCYITLSGGASRDTSLIAYCWYMRLLIIALATEVIDLARFLLSYFRYS